jgi:Cytochrome P450
MSPSCCSHGKGTSHASTNFSALAQKMTSSPLWVNGSEFVMSYANDSTTQKRIVGVIILILSCIRLMTLKKKGPLFRVRGYPIIGNLLTFVPGRSAFSNVSKLLKIHGNLLELFTLSHRIVVVADIAIAKECLVKRPKSFRRTEALEIPAKLFGFSKKNGVLFAEGKDWSRLRRLTAPAFSHRNVELMSEAISKEIDVFMARLKSLKSDEIVPMDMQNFFYTVGVITSVAFGDIPEESKGLFHTATVAKVLHCIVVYCPVLYRTVLYCTVLGCTALYCTVLNCAELHCTVLFNTFSTMNIILSYL